MVAIYFLFYLVLKISQHLSFHTNAIDLSIFDYALWNALRGHGLFTPFLQGSFLKEHFSPFLFLVAPVYGIHSSPFFLLSIQSFLVAAAAIPLFLLARKKVENNLVLLAVVFAYLNNWFVVRGLLYDFHVEMAEPAIVLAMFWAYLEEKNILYWCFLLLALMCKEDMGLYLSAWGLFLWFKEKKPVKAWRHW